MKILTFITAVMLGCWEVVGAVGFYFPPDAVGDGNSSLAPFNDHTRLQQVYGHEAFPSIGPDSAFLIQTILFRADENRTGAGSANLSSLEVHLSSTSRNPDGLSTVYSENIGPDDVTVLGPGPLNLRWEEAQFFTAFHLDRPFLYNPAAGNLLLDMRIDNPGTFAPMDAFEASGDSVSVVAGLPDATTGFALTRGLATFFVTEVVPVPEPSTIALLLVSVLALAWRFRGTNKSRP